MNKIKDYLLEVSFLLVLARFVTTSPNISDSVVLISLVGAIVYVKSYLAQKTHDYTETQQKQLDELTRKVEALNFQNSVKRTSVNNEQERKVSNARF
jgi:hypothetical protein